MARRWRLPRPRFTVRWLMIAVAIVGVVLGVTIERRGRFRKIAAHHRGECGNLINRSPYVAFSNYSEATNRRIDWHHSMWLRYEDAARSPWLPVAPDSPEPK